MVLTLNGVDIVPYIAYGGVKWQRFDLDGEGAGRGLDGLVIRDRIATKRRLDITCKPLTLREASRVLSVISPEFVQARFTDPARGGVYSCRMYSNNNPAQFLMVQKNGTELWGGITFPLIEE